MNKTWAEIRTAAAVFARDHADDRDEKRESQTFWNEFFGNVFGVNRRRVAVYEQSVTKLSGAKGRIDLFWSGELIIEQKSFGVICCGRAPSQRRLHLVEYENETSTLFIG